MLNAVMVKFWQHFNAIFLPYMATQNSFKRASILPIMAKFDCMMKWLAWSMKSHSTVVKSMPLREQIPAALRKLDDHQFIITLAGHCAVKLIGEYSPRWRFVEIWLPLV
jgi:hypothetical protein